MINIYKTTNDTLKEFDKIEPGCWVNVFAPTDDEITRLSNQTNVPIDFLRAALDEEETSRIDVEDKNMLVIVDMPFVGDENNSLIYDTYPLAIINNDSFLITVCLKDSAILSDFAHEKIRSFFTFKRSRFILQILYRIAAYYLIYLRQIDKKSLLIEKTLHKSLRNKELIQLLALEKSLVYFSTSLKSNEITLEKMLKIELFQRYEEDQDVLEDVIIENKQAIEMANIYSNILSGTMDAFASIISNNLNIVMKLLASITIVMAIPTMISGLFGMNVKGIPFANSNFGFWWVIVIIVILSVSVTTYLNKKDMF